MSNKYTKDLEVLNQLQQNELTRLYAKCELNRQVKNWTVILTVVIGLIIWIV